MSVAAVLGCAVLASYYSALASTSGGASLSPLAWLGPAIFLWATVSCSFLCLLYHLHRYSAVAGALGASLAPAGLLYYMVLVMSPNKDSSRVAFTAALFSLAVSVVLSSLILRVSPTNIVIRIVQLLGAVATSVAIALAISRIPLPLMLDFISSTAMLPVALIAALGGSALILYVMGRRELWHFWQAGVLYLFCMAGLLFVSLYDNGLHIDDVAPILASVCLSLFPIAALFDAWQLLALQPSASLSGTQEAVTDPLTGIYNRRALDETGPKIVASALRSNQPVTLLMLDIDHFKQVNDLYGHSAGDMVLREFVKIIVHQIRATDFAARYGGEEFVAILPGAPLAPAMRLADRVRTEAERSEIVFEGRRIKITTSIGASAIFPGDSVSFAELLDRADRNLFRAKRSGRNQVLADPLMSEEMA